MDSIVEYYGDSMKPGNNNNTSVQGVVNADTLTPGLFRRNSTANMEGSPTPPPASPDFILCIGGDKSDEPMFELLTSSGLSQL